MTKSRRALLATATALLIGAACTTSTKANNNVKPAGSRRAAPHFELKDGDGKPVKLSDYKGKVVLLNFWATWCGPCKIEIPWFIDFENQFKDKGFAVLGVAMDEEGWEIVRPYIQQKKVNYRVLMGNDTVAQLYGGVDSLPTTFVLDRDGKIAAVHVGLVSKSEYQKDIQQLLDQTQRTDNGGDASAAAVARAN